MHPPMTAGTMEDPHALLTAGYTMHLYSFGVQFTSRALKIFMSFAPVILLLGI